ncbi:MAG: hypothetical protein JW795_14760 [Chitinivibrionales bacterium]|nr:hypothetical protein [Chitinivibrionales bacterium]
MVHKKKTAYSNVIAVAGILIFFQLALTWGQSGATAKRTPFSLPLIKLNLNDDEENRNFKSVRVELRPEEEYALITRINDIHIKNSGKEIHKTIYAEVPEQAQYASQFEVQTLDRVIESLTNTLGTLDILLTKKQWDKCLYLDAFFPRFLQCFYHLNCAIFASKEILPLQAQIADSLFDVSMHSLKSDQRIDRWQGGDASIKLRIVAKEFSYQLDYWQKRDLEKKQRNRQISMIASPLQNIYVLFIKTYFLLAR